MRKLDLFRVVILHHPPEDHPTIHRKALQDRILFREVLARTGAELILHGHQHHSHFGSIPGPIGKIPVLGVPFSIDGSKSDQRGRSTMEFY